MNVSRLIACYHEAGHAVAAYYIDRNLLANAHITIEQNDEELWEGDPGIAPDAIQPKWTADVALAGLLAEARHNAYANPAVGMFRSVELAEDQEDLAARLVAYYGLEDGAEKHAAMEHTLVRVQLPNNQAFNVEAAVSVPDLDTIPENRRAEAPIDRAISRLVAFFNNDDVWVRVRSLAEALDEFNWNQDAVLFDYIEFCRATGLRP